MTSIASDTSASNGPLFTVLLPTHNRADVLPFAVKSVLAQSLRDFQLFIVGDGCTDNTAAVLQQFADPRVTYFDLPKAPHFGYGNRNVALQRATAPLVAYMQHDDLWLPDHLARLHAAFTRPHIEWVYSRPLWVIPPGLIAPGTFNLEYPPTLQAFLARKQSAIPTCCVAHRRSCFEAVGYWDASLPANGDWDLWVRMLRAPVGGISNFTYLPEPTSLHFRAHWRKAPQHIREHELVWKELHQVKDFLPAALRIPVAEGMTEQEACWRLLEADPTAVTRDLRSAVWQALDLRVAQSNRVMESLLAHKPLLKIAKGLRQAIKSIKGTQE